MPEINLTLPPLRAAQNYLYKNMQRFNVWVCHRRFGKTVLTLLLLFIRALECRKLNPRFAYFCPTRTQAKDVAWTYLQHLAQGIPGVDINQAELRITLPNAATITLYGADNYKLGSSRRGMYWDGVVIDEYADISPTVWTQVIRPALTDRKGWACFIGTPRGKNHFYDLYRQARNWPDWHRATFPVSTTEIVDYDELAQAHDIMSDAEYLQEFECSWDAPMPGAVYATQLAEMDSDARVCVLAYDPTLPTYTAWDIGPANTAIWFFQPAGEFIHFIDYVEGSGSLEEWIRLVKSKPYIYDHSKIGLTTDKHEVHFGPHDLEYKDYATKKTRIGVALEADFRFRVLGRGTVEDGIESGRKLLDRSRFDESRCEEGLAALRSYRYDFDDRLQTYRRTPHKDWASHGADAFRYAAVGLIPPPKKQGQKIPPGSFEWWARQAEKARRSGRHRIPALPIRIPPQAP